MAVPPRAATRRALAVAIAGLLALAAPPSAGALQAPDAAGTSPSSASRDLEREGGEASGARAILESARGLLDAGMPVTASSFLARELSSGRVAGSEAVLLAARAHADQRAWPAVRRLLAGRAWEDPADDHEARRLLARAHLATDRPDLAAAEYARLLAGPSDSAASGSASGSVRPEVRVRYADALLALDRRKEAAGQLALAATEHPELGRWMRLSELYVRAGSGDSTAFSLAETLAGDPLVPRDSALATAARLAFRLGRPARGLELARRAGEGVEAALAAELIAPYLLSTGDTAGAVAAYRDAVRGRRAGPEAAAKLVELDPAWRALLEVGRAELSAGRRVNGTRYLTRALGLAPPAAAPEIAEALAGAHRAAGDCARAITTLEPWLGGRPLSETRRGSVWLLAARCFEAMGQSGAASEAYATAATGSGSSAAFAAYLLADHLHDAGRLDDAASAYEVAIARFPGSRYGARALSRLAMLHFHLGRHAEARARLESYRARYPRDGWQQGALYWIGRTHEAEGDTATARELYRRTIGHDPLDYYAILAARRTGDDRWEKLGMVSASPTPPLHSSYAEALARMKTLRELGWNGRARRELAAARERGPSDPGQLLALAHELNEAGWTQQGIRLGWEARRRGRGWTRATLAAIYPLPFREAVRSVAEDRRLPVALVAGLSRRESLFDPEIVSPANAVGLMQLLPRTAQDVSGRAGLPEYGRHQLTVPQVNLLLGTRYLADLLTRFGGSRVAAMISYNAGPHRFLSWRDFPEFASEEELVERIPFRETREYVRAVTALTAIYEWLYDLPPTP